MIQSNRLTVIVDDGAVYTDTGIVLNINLHECGIPPDVHALQWRDGVGEIELRSTEPNIPITDLPEWALQCYNMWEANYVESDIPE